jgi:hypothetical protein
MSGLLVTLFFLCAATAATIEAYRSGARLAYSLGYGFGVGLCCSILLLGLITFFNWII